jgi:hypothetical protein
MFGGEKFKEFFGEVSFGTPDPPPSTPSTSSATTHHCRAAAFLQSNTSPPLRTPASRRPTGSSPSEHSFSLSSSPTWRATKKVRLAFYTCLSFSITHFSIFLSLFFFPRLQAVDHHTGRRAEGRRARRGVAIPRTHGLAIIIIIYLLNNI